MTLGELGRAGLGTAVGSPDQQVRGVQHDSRRVEHGDLFAAIRGSRYDGTRFVPDALARGASAILCDRRLDHDVPQLIVEDVRTGLGRAAELIYGKPTEKLRTTGITGTNGKTTTAALLVRAIEAASGVAASIGTTGLSIGENARSSTHTTPEGDDISRFARQALDAGATHLVLEVSSHGLALGRVDALSFDVAAFTNLSRDHLDFHETFEAYGQAKARLFTELRPKTAVIHVDDDFGKALAAQVPMPIVRCSKEPGVEAEIVANPWSVSRQGIRATVHTPRGVVALESPLLGEHNLENALVALGCAHALGLDLERVSEGWRTFEGTPGRLERVAHPDDVAILVDYAHTPAALGRALTTLRAITPGRLLVVFGAGGDRDRGKRPEMGRVAGETADVCLVTSDNPRSEDPQAIADAIETGVVGAGVPRLDVTRLGEADRGYVVVLDRREAIANAVAAARHGDSVLIAGKGHETYQIVGTERRHFDDREEAAEAIARLRGTD